MGCPGQGLTCFAFGESAELVHSLHCAPPLPIFHTLTPSALSVQTYGSVAGPVHVAPADAGMHHGKPVQLVGGGDLLRCARGGCAGA
eukprot:scaffold1734_cov113-Isochrysis_galbana.AAC.14